MSFLNPKSKLAYFATNIILLLGIILAIEFTLRLFKLGYIHTLIDQDRILHHVHPKDCFFLYYSPSNEYKPTQVYYDEEGLVSNPKFRGLKREVTNKDLIVFMGDSFTEALQVDYDKSFVGILESRLKNYSLKNFGIASYSPILYYLQWKYKISRLKPKVVFLMLFDWDIYDDKFYLPLAKFSNNGELIAVDGGAPGRIKKLLRKLYIARFSKKVFLTIKYSLARQKQQILEPEPNWTELTARYVLKTAEAVKASQARFILLLTHPLEFQNAWVKWANENGIEYIPLSEALGFKATKDTGKKQYFTLDRHFNKYGHIVVANEIERYLSRGQYK